MTVQLRQKLTVQPDLDLLKRFSIPFRYYVILMSLIGPILMYASRCVINFAILAMVREGSEELRGEAKNHGDNKSDVLEVTINEFHWNQHEQGQIIGAYYYSYTAAQLFSGYFADKMDVVGLMSTAYFLSSLTLLITPLAARTHILLLISVRILQGFLHTPISSASYILFEKWFPPMEKSLAQSLLVVGSNLGIALVMPYTAWICDLGLFGGWPLAFYILGISSLFFSILLFFTVSSSPEQSRFISAQETKYLASVIVQSLKEQRPKVSWSRLLSSPVLWSLTFARGAGGLAYHLVNSKVPTFLETVLHYNLQRNGLINATLYIIEGLVQLICGPLSKYIILNKWLSNTNTRKTFESFTLLGPGICFLLLPFLQNNAEMTVACLITSMLFMGAQTGGDLPIIPEMAPNIIGTVYGFSNFIACACGFLSPIVTALILNDQPSSASRWNIIFYSFGGFQILGFIFFILFVSSKPQNWTVSDEEEEKKQKELC